MTLFDLKLIISEQIGVQSTDRIMERTLSRLSIKDWFIEKEWLDDEQKRDDVVRAVALKIQKIVKDVLRMRREPDAIKLYAEYAKTGERK